MFAAYSLQRLTDIEMMSWLKQLVLLRNLTALNALKRVG